MSDTFRAYISHPSPHNCHLCAVLHICCSRSPSVDRPPQQCSPSPGTMSKTLIVFCLLAVLAVANAQRKLDCEGAKQLYGNRCCLMCNCAGLGNARQECIKQCNECVAGCNQKTPTFDKCKAVSAIESKVQSCLAEFDSKSKEGEKALKEAMDKYAKDKDGKTVC